MPSLTEDVQTAIRALTGVSTNTLNGDWSALADAMGVAAPGQVDGRVLGAAKLIDPNVPTVDAAYNLFLYNPQLIPALSLPFTASDTLDSRITFTRASSGTHFDSTGRLVTDANDVARFDYDPATLLPRGLLIEESRTNLLLHSRDMTQAAWAKTDVTAARTQVGIDGSANSACLMTEGSAGTAEVIQGSAAVAAGSTITASVVFIRGNTDWLRIRLVAAGGSNGANAWFNLATGIAGTTSAIGTGSSISSAITNLGGGRYRCSVTCLPDGTYTLPFVSLQSASANGSSTRVNNATYIVDAAQLEVGAFATSIINTGAATATRAADSAVMTGTNFSSWFNASAGTFVAEFGPTFYNGSGGASGVFSANDNSPSNKIDFRSTTGQALAVGGTGWNIATGSPTLGTINKVAIAYAAGAQSVSRNGATVVTASAAVLPSGINRLQIGGLDSLSLYQLNGPIRSLRFYSTNLPDATLRALST